MAKRHNCTSEIFKSIDSNIHIYYKKNGGNYQNE